MTTLVFDIAGGIVLGGCGLTTLVWVVLRIKEAKERRWRRRNWGC